HFAGLEDPHTGLSRYDVAPGRASRRCSQVHLVGAEPGDVERVVHRGATKRRRRDPVQVAQRDPKAVRAEAVALAAGLLTFAGDGHTEAAQELGFGHGQVAVTERAVGSDEVVVARQAIAGHVARSFGRRAGARGFRAFFANPR